MMTVQTTVSNIAESTTDTDLDFWSSVYSEGRLTELDHQLRFAEFLRSPWKHLERLGATDAAECVSNGFRPLLPAQRRVRDRLDQGNVVQLHR